MCLGLLQDVKYIQTDGYRAPEAELQNCLAQAGLQSETECTSAVDLWSLGIVLLEMFSGMKLKHTVQSQEWKVRQFLLAPNESFGFLFIIWICEIAPGK